MSDPSFFTTPTGIAVIAAGSSFVAGLLGTTISSWTTRVTHRQRLAVDERLAARKLEFDKELAERRATADIALAQKKFSLDRAFATWKRRSELAEQALIRFNETQKVFQWVRSPGSFGGEGESRSSEKGEDDRVKRQRNMYFIPIERLQREKELFSSLQTLRPTFEAHFGPQAGMPFNEIARIYTEITSAAYTLIEVAKFNIPPPPPSFGNGQPPNAPLLNTLGWGPADRPDEIDRRIEAAVEAIRALCDPVLAWTPEA